MKEFPVIVVQAAGVDQVRVSAGGVASIFITLQVVVELLTLSRTYHVYL